MGGLHNITVDLAGTDIDGTIASVTVTTLPPATQGVLYLADGTTAVTAGTALTPAQAANLVFVPANNFNGDVTIPFTVTDNDGATSPSANEVITVNPVDDAFTDENETVSTNEDVALSGNLLTGTSSVDGTVSVTTFTIDGTTYNAGETATITDKGTLLINSDGSYTFTPVANYNGAVPQVTYTMSDGSSTDTSTLDITVDPVNDAPSGMNTTVSHDEDTNYTFIVSNFGFSDPIESNSLSGVKITTLPANGTLYIDSNNNGIIDTGEAVTEGTTVSIADINDGKLKFYDGVNKNGTTSFTFQVVDNGGTANGGVDTDQSANTMTINTTAVNDAPVATADTNSVTEDGADADSNPNTTIIVGSSVLTNDTDVDTGDTKAVSGVQAGTQTGDLTDTSTVGADVTGTYGTVNIANDGTYTYTLDNTNTSVQALAVGEKATETFSYTMVDSQGATSTTTLTITINGTNDAPVIDVRSGDSDAETIAETNTTLTTSGTLNVSDFDTSDTVAASKADTITVGGTYKDGGGTPPTDAELIAMFSVNGGESSTTAQDAPNGINWKFNSGSQYFDAIPAGQTLTLTYTVNATDTHGATTSHPVTVTITGIDDGGVINPDTASTNENTNLSGNVLTNDEPDPDYNEPLSVTSFTVDANGDDTQDTFTVSSGGNTSATITTTSGTIGTITIGSDGAYTFVPYDNYSGAVPTITYTAGNGTFSDSDTLNITVNPVSDAPGVTSDAATVYTLEDTSVALGFNAPSVTDNTDLNGTATGDNPELLSVITLSGIPNGAVLTYGSYNYTSTGADITVVLSDGSHISGATGTLTMTMAQFNAMTVTPVPQSGVDFTVTMSVTEHEVDDSGNPLSGVAGAHQLRVLQLMCSQLLIRLL